VTFLRACVVALWEAFNAKRELHQTNNVRARASICWVFHRQQNTTVQRTCYRWMSRRCGLTTQHREPTRRPVFVWCLSLAQQARPKSLFLCVSTRATFTARYCMIDCIIEEVPFDDIFPIIHLREEAVADVASVVVSRCDGTVYDVNERHQISNMWLWRKYKMIGIRSFCTPNKCFSFCCQRTLFLLRGDCLWPKWIKQSVNAVHFSKFKNERIQLVSVPRALCVVEVFSHRGAVWW